MSDNWLKQKIDALICISMHTLIYLFIFSVLFTRLLPLKERIKLTRNQNAAALKETNKQTNTHRDSLARRIFVSPSPRLQHTG